MSALDARQLKEISIQEYDIRRKIYEAKNLKPAPIVIKPPEGYYIPGEAYQQYKDAAYDYNRRLNQYKNELREAWKEVKANQRSIEEYDRLMKRYVEQLEENAPQRREFIEYIQNEGFVGPRPPTGVAKKRQEAGIPQRGIPGPALGPAPGSIGETLQDIIGESLDVTEKPFRLLTDPIRGASRELQELSIDELRTERAVQPPTQYGTQIDFSVQEPIMAPSEPRPASGFAAYLGSVALDTVAAAADIATFESRPGLIAETAGGLIGLAVDPEMRQSLTDKIAYDPFRFISTTVGGPILVYPETVGNLASKIRRIKAEKWLKELGVDESKLLPFESELNLGFPEEIVDYTPRTSLFKRGTLNILDDVGLVKEKLPYYLETSPEIEQFFQSPKEDPFAVKLIKKADDSYYALPFNEEGGAILVRGKAGMKPFTEPPAPLPPRNEAIALTTTKPVFMGLKIPETSFFTTNFVETIETSIAAADLRAATIATPRSASTLFTNFLSPLAAITSTLNKTDQKLKNIQAESLKVPQAPKSIENLEENMRKALSSVQNLVTPQIQNIIQEPVITPIQVQSQRQKQPTIQLQKLEISLEAPKLPDFKPPQPPPPVKPPKLQAERKPRKKKKKKQKIKGAYELRVDTIAKELLKEFKL